MPDPAWTGLEHVRDAVLRRWSGSTPDIHSIHFVPSTSWIGVYVFFEHNKDLDAVKSRGDVAVIRKTLMEELDAVGRGASSGIQIKVEFDSDQNVKENFSGSYFFRLR